jgi:hypothetical protein
MYRIATGAAGGVEDAEAERLVDQLLSIFWDGAAGPRTRKGDA